MAIWPFRFKGSPKSPGGGGGGAALSAPEPPPIPPTASPKEAPRPQRSASKRKQAALVPEEAAARSPRSFTFTAHRSGSIRIGRKKQDEAPSADPQRDHVARDLFPTLHHKRTNSDFTSRKSAHRTQEEHAREAHVKAISRFRFVPIRAATFHGDSDVPPKQIHRRARTEAIEPSWHPASDLSLPRQSSLTSSLSSESELAAYKVSALDALAPRPTLRCVGSKTPLVRSSVLAQAGAPQKRPLGDREPIPEETLRAHKRIDDLADDLDASDLRELMERDARRRERQRQHERDKAERKLLRKAEKQKLKEAEARESGGPLPTNLERGVVGRELAGLCRDPPSAVVTSSKRRSSPEPTPRCRDGASSKGDSPVGASSPLRSFRLPSEGPSESMNPSPTMDNPPTPGGLVEDGEPIAYSPIDGKKEKMSSGGEDGEAAARNEPVVFVNGKINHLSLISLIKWSFRGRRNSSGPSSFSNTSREEMQAAAAAAAAGGGGAQSRAQNESHSAPATLAGSWMSRASSKTPRRTRSRFREDLPEHPLSPKMPSAESPRAEETEATWPEDGKTLEMVPEQISGSSPVAIPTARRSTTPMADSQLAMSFASVDSEGSWLASRIGSQRSVSREAASLKRSNRVQGPKWDDTDGNGQHHHAQDENGERIEDDNRDEKEDGHQNDKEDDRKRGGEDENDCVETHYKGIEDQTLQGGANARWIGVSNQPQAVQIHGPSRDTIASREVLLDIDSCDEEEEDVDVDAESPVSAGSEEKASLGEARRLSVSHVRSLSARSAKLLEVRFGRHSLNETRRPRW